MCWRSARSTRITISKAQGLHADEDLDSRGLDNRPIAWALSRDRERNRARARRCEFSDLRRSCFDRMPACMPGALTLSVAAWTLRRCGIHGTERCERRDSLYHRREQKQDQRRNACPVHHAESLAESVFVHAQKGSSHLYRHVFRFNGKRRQSVLTRDSADS